MEIKLYCDKCKQPIRDKEADWVEFKDGLDKEPDWVEFKGGLTDDECLGYYCFRLVHHRCRSHSTAANFCNLNIDYLSGIEGLIVCLELLRLSQDKNEVAELIKRLHIPYYDQARRYQKIYYENFSIAGLKEIVRRYEDSESQ